MKKVKELFNKNRIVSIFIIVFVLLLLIMSIFWLSKKGTFGYSVLVGDIVIDCPSVVSGGQTVSCDVRLESVNPMAVYSINANYHFSDNLTFQSFSYDRECTGEENCFELFEATADNEENTNEFASDNGFVVLNTNGVVDGGYIGTLKFKVADHIEPNEEFEVGLDNIYICYDNFGVEAMLPAFNVSTTLRAGSSVATLSSLYIPDTDYFDDFDSLTNEYYISVLRGDDFSRFVFDYSTTSPGATVTINGIEDPSDHIFELAYGDNVFNIVVTAENNQSTMTYTVTINKEFTFSTDVYPYLEEYNVLYTGSDSYDEIVTKLGSLGENVLYNLDLFENKLYILSNDGLYEILFAVDILRFGIDYPIYDNIFYLNEPLTYDDLLDNVYDENLNVVLLDNYGIQIFDYENTIEAGYYLELYYNGLQLASYQFLVSDFDFDSSLVIDDVNYVISRVQAGTTAEELKEMVDIPEDAVIYDNNGEVVSEDALVATGYTISIAISGESQESDGETLTYTISVLGDINGDGEIYINDVGMLYRYYMGYLTELTQAQIYAGDIINDGEIYINDVGRLYRYYMGYEFSLEVLTDE